MKLQTLPPNVSEALSSAPDGSERDGAENSQQLSSLRFPVFNRGPSILIDLLVLAGLVTLISGLAAQQHFSYKKLWGADVNSLTYSILPFTGILLLFIRDAFRSWFHRIVVVLIAIAVNVFSFIASDWIYQVIIGLVALFYFLDLYFLNAIALRFNAVNPCDKLAAERVAKARLSLSDNAPINLLSYLFPLVILSACSLQVRANLKRHIEASGETPIAETIGTAADVFNPQRSGNELAFFVLVLTSLALVPIVVDHFAGRFGFQSFGIKRLWKEYCEGIKSWFRYNSATVLHPAVLQSPAGTNFQRRAIFLGALLFTVPIAMPTLIQTLQIDRLQKEINASDRVEYERFKYDTKESDKQSRGNNSAPSVVRLVAYAVAQDDFVSDTITIKPLTPTDERAANEKKKELVESQERARQREIIDRAWKNRSRAISEDPARLFVGIPNLIIILLGPVMPVIFLFAILFSATARPMAILTEQLGPLPNSNQLTSGNWRKIVSRLRAENTTEGREEIFWGVDARNQTPILVPRSVIREHVHFLGDTGSGKTSMGIAPLVTQLVESGDCSVVVIDLKGDDQSLFELMRLGAAKNSQIDPDLESDSKSWTHPFSYFTSKHNLPSHAFNPFLQAGFKELSTLQKTDLLTTALGLQYGTDYGRKYFGDANFTVLQKTLEFSPEVDSFVELAKELREVVRTQFGRETQQASSNLVMSIERLAATPVVNLSAASPNFDPASLIDLGDLFVRPQAVYVSLPSATGSVVNADLGRLVLFSLINSAQHSVKPRKQVFLVIDEFQRLVSNHIAVLLQMARGLDIGVILSNQSMSDLNQVDAKILSTVTTNTRLRQVFGISDPLEIQQLIDVSGERTVFHRTFTEAARRFMFGFRPDSRSFSESISPRLRVNDIIEASDNPNQSLFLMRRGTGNARFRGYPFVLESTFHISQKEYDDRVLKPWPAQTATARVWTDATSQTCQVAPVQPTPQTPPQPAPPQPTLAPTPSPTASQAPEQQQTSELADQPPEEIERKSPTSDSKSAPPVPEDLKESLLQTLDSFWDKKKPPDQDKT